MWSQSRHKMFSFPSFLPFSIIGEETVWLNMDIHADSTLQKKRTWWLISPLILPVHKTRVAENEHLVQFYCRWLLHTRFLINSRKTAVTLLQDNSGRNYRCNLLRHGFLICRLIWMQMKGRIQSHTYLCLFSTAHVSCLILGSPQILKNRCAQHRHRNNAQNHQIGSIKSYG